MTLIIDLRHDIYMELKIEAAKKCGEESRNLRGFERMEYVINCEKELLNKYALYKRRGGGWLCLRWP